MYIAVVYILFWGYRSFFIRCPKYRIQPLVSYSSYIIPILIFSLLNISSFLILSLFVTHSIFRRHAIPNTLSLCFCFSLSVHVSALYMYSRVLNISTSYTRILWPCNAQFFGVPCTPSPAPAKFPSPTHLSFPHHCQTPLVC